MFSYALNSRFIYKQGQVLLYTAIRFCALLIILYCTSPSLYAQSISVVTEDWEPYNYIDNNKVVGISTQVVRNVLQRADIEIDGGIQVFPWARAYKMVRENKNTLIYTLIRTPDRENKFHWIGPIVEAKKFYFYKASSRKDIKIDNLDDAKKYKVSIHRDTLHAEFLAQNGFSKDRIQTIDDQSKSLVLLLRGRIDLIIDTDMSLKAMADMRGLDMSLFERSIELIDFGYYMAFNLDTDKEIIKRVQDAFDAVGPEFKDFEQ